ncbi:MAG: hypothetical protein ACK5TN_17185 [Acidobacteriota bacterium]
MAEWIVWMALLGLEPHKLATGVVSLGAPTRDGRYLTHVREGDLAVRDLASGTDRLLTRRAGREFAYFSVPSGRGQWVAYAWFNEQGFYELRLAPLAGGPHRVLFRNAEAGFVQPCAFTADERKVLTLLFRRDNTSQIVLVGVEDGQVETLRSLAWVYPKRMDLSPDGRFVVYDSFRPDSKTERAIYVLAVDGSSERLLTPEPGSWLFPFFSPDGRSVLYAGGEADSLDLWRKPLEGGGSARVAQSLGRALPLGWSSGGRFVFGRRKAASDLFTLDPAEPRRVKLLGKSFAGMNRGAVFSPDGKWMAYLSRRGAENYGQESRTVLLRDLAGGLERDLAPRLAYIDRLSWGPGGLLASGSDGRGRAGVFAIDTQSGRVSALLAEPGGPYRGFRAGVDERGALFWLKEGKLWRRDSAGQAEETGLRGSALAVRGGQLALLAGSEVTILDTAKLELVARQHCEGCTEMAWGKTLLGAGPKTLVRLPGGAIEGPAWREGPVEFLADGVTLAVTLSMGQEEIWALEVKP